MIRLEFYGGFHNMRPKRVLVPENRYEDFLNGLITKREMLTPYQQRRLDKHFCGIRDCRCGGLDCAEWRRVKKLKYGMDY